MEERTRCCNLELLIYNEITRIRIPWPTCGIKLSKTLANIFGDS